MHYLIAEGGAVNGAAAKQFTILVILSGEEKKRVAINERSTIGSVCPNAQLFNNKSLTGSGIALAIGSSQVKNLFNQSTGVYGSTLLKSTNLLNSETAIPMNALSNLLALCGKPMQKRGCN